MYADLTADYVLFGFLVTRNGNILDSGLRAFHHTDLKIDRIIIYGSFHRIGLEEQVTVVQVEAADIATFW